MRAVLAAAALVGALACDDPTAPDRLEATFALREGFSLFAPTGGLPITLPATDPRCSPSVFLRPHVPDTLVFRADGSGERRGLAWLSPCPEPPPAEPDVETFRYERDGDTVVITWGPDCANVCDIAVPAPTTFVLRDGVLYQQVVGIIEYPFDPVGPGSP